MFIGNEYFVIASLGWTLLRLVSRLAKSGGSMTGLAQCQKAMGNSIYPPKGAFPNDCSAPSSFAKCIAHTSITLAVFVDLLSPVLNIRNRQTCMLAAFVCMPEATVNEYGKVGPGQDKVRSSPQVRWG